MPRLENGTTIIAIWRKLDDKYDVPTESEAMNVYSIEISISLGDAVPQVGALLKELNSVSSRFGVEEKLSVRSKCVTCTLKSHRELSKEDREKVKAILIAEFNMVHPAWRVQVESFRRKSGNVQQQAA